MRVRANYYVTGALRTLHVRASPARGIIFPDDATRANIGYLEIFTRERSHLS